MNDLFSTPQGKEIKEFLIKEFLTLKDINNVKEYSSASDQAIELKAQKKAVKVLENILYKMSGTKIELSTKEEDSYVVQ
jgi:hypothetical protein